MSDTPPAPFIVRGQWPGGSVRYLCATAAAALAKLRDFERAGYTDITILGPDGAAMTEAALLQAQEAEQSGEADGPDGGAPVDPGAAQAPLLVP